MAMETEGESYYELRSGRRRKISKEERLRKRFPDEEERTAFNGYDVYSGIPAKVRDDAHAKYVEVVLRNAEWGLQHFNQFSKPKEDPEYVFVEPRDCQGSFCNAKAWYHQNFLAKPKDAPDTEAKLFFLELERDRVIDTHKGLEVVFKVNICCILDLKPGEGRPAINGCRACIAVDHPLDGFCLLCPGYYLGLRPGEKPRKKRGVCHETQKKRRTRRKY